MYKSNRVTLCLPCRNEAGHLEDVIKRVPKFVDEIIVISNKSTDNTVDAARALGLNAYEDNRAIDGIGYGFAHMTGISKATGDLIVGADGDATYPIEDLANVIDHMLAQELDFVSCSRYPLKPGTKIPLKLKAGVWALNTEVKLLYGIKINDILSGMWVLKRDVKDKLALTMGDWNLSPQIKLNAACHPDIAFGEYGIVQHDRKGESHQQHYKTGISHMVWIMQNRRSAFVKHNKTAVKASAIDA
jgi:glycosyltransferase involved in cell wall biosynthesis